MTAAVCMGTYNGANYVEEQLRSILEQIRRPDEVILCDDGSGDGTGELIREFLACHSLEESWKFYLNPERQGYPANFYHAMSLAESEVVFLADQDDVWEPDKIQEMLRCMEQHPEILVLCSRYDLIDAQGQRLYTLLAPPKGRDTGKTEKISASDVFYQCQWPGMVLAYRNAWWKQYGARFPVGSEIARRVPHDLLLCAAAAQEGGFYRLDLTLAHHRRHSANTGGEEHRIRRLLNKPRKIREIEEYLRILEALERGEALTRQEGIRALKEKQKSLEGRRDALLSGKYSQILRHAGRYRRNTRLMTLICDLLIAGQKYEKNQTGGENRD